MKTATIGMALAMLAANGLAHGAECVNAKTAKAGFVLEMPGIRSEFRPAAGGMVSVANTYQSESPQTQFLFAGLIEVFRDSDTGHLRREEHDAVRRAFAEETAEGTKTLELAVKGKETFSLGDCKYTVLAVKETIKNQAGETLDAFTALYAPDLQAALARRYDEGTKSESVVGYEVIKPLAQ